MNTYLCIITTILVITQVIRVTQNAIQLYRQNKSIERDLNWIKDRDITKDDFDVQKKCFYMLLNWLEKEEEKDNE